jgi:purine-binding chemotaxis protein CheW
MSELTIETASAADATPSAGTASPAANVALDAERYLTFTLGGETYALDILDITEIIEFRSLTVVPMMPPFVRGVINLRGRVLPVIDLSSRFGQPATEVGRRTGIIVVHPGGRAASGVAAQGGSDDAGHADAGQGIGIMVDTVNKVVHLGASEIEPPPDFGGGLRADFISGMAKHEGQFVIVLDVGQLLAGDEMDEMVRLAGASG